MRIGECLDLTKFSHQAFINGHPARCVEDQDIKTLEFCRLQRPPGNVCRGFTIGLGQHANLGLLTKNAELLTRCGARHVQRGKHDLLPLTGAKTQRQLAGSGCLARALKAGH